MDEVLIEVEVAYAKPEEQCILRVRGPRTMNLEEAIQRSGMLHRFPEIDPKLPRVGVFGKALAKDTTLNPGDRVEIYRALIADPKEARKKRGVQKNGGKDAERGVDG